MKSSFDWLLDFSDERDDDQVNWVWEIEESYLRDRIRVSNSKKGINEDMQEFGKGKDFSFEI